MKRKEIIQLVVAVVVIFIAGLLIFTALSPKKKSASNDKYMVEKVTPIDADFDEEALQQINSSKVRDFYTEPDLGSGLGNDQPFSPVR